MGNYNRANILLGRFNRNDLRAKGMDGLIALIFEMEAELKKAGQYCEELERENEAQRKQLLALKEAKKPRNRYEGYDPSKSWACKLVFILERNSTPLSVAQIKTELLKLEPDISDRWANVEHYLSQVLLRACQRGAIVKQKSLLERGNVYKPFSSSFPKNLV